MADVSREKNNNNKIEVFHVKQVAFGISLSVIKGFIFIDWIFIELFIQCSVSGHSLAIETVDHFNYRPISCGIYLNVLNNFQWGVI